MHTLLASRLRIIRSIKQKTPPALGTKASKNIPDLFEEIGRCDRAESPRPSTSKGSETVLTDLLVSGKIGQQIHPQTESHQHQFLSRKESYKPELLSIEENLQLQPLQETSSLSVIGSADDTDGYPKQAVLSKVDDPNLWCRHSTEECFSTCVTVDFFIATLKSAWIAIVLLLYFKTPFISPTPGSLLDSIMDENSSSSNSTLIVCEKIYKWNHEQKKPFLIAILIMGFPILPLELCLTKVIFYAIEMRSRRKCIFWLGCRVLLSIMFMVQTGFKLMCFTFENFDMATIPEVIYRFFEVHVALRFLEEINIGLPPPVYKRKVSFQPSHQSFII